MGQKITVQRTELADIITRYPRFGTSLRCRGIVARLIITAGTPATEIWENKTGFLHFIAGSHRLFERFLTESEATR